MTALEAAVAEVASVLESLSLPYMLIGGLAVSLWGEARATLDADVTTWVEPGQIAQAVQKLCRKLRASTSDPISFVERTRVLPAESSQGVRVDIIFAALPWEKAAIERARPKHIAGRKVMVASVEDLILMKLVSERQRDQEDARRLLRRHAKSVERNYLEPRVSELAQALGRPDLVETLRTSLR